MKHCVIRHIKKQVFEGEQILKLPARAQSVRILEMTANEAKLYKELEEKAGEIFLATTGELIVVRTRLLA